MRIGKRLKRDIFFIKDLGLRHELIVFVNLNKYFVFPQYMSITEMDSIEDDKGKINQ